MNDLDEKVALQAIEFWSTVCDVEIAVKAEIEEVNILRKERGNGLRTGGANKWGLGTCHWRTT